MLIHAGQIDIPSNMVVRAGQIDFPSNMLVQAGQIDCLAKVQAQHGGMAASRSGIYKQTLKKKVKNNKNKDNTIRMTLKTEAACCSHRSAGLHDTVALQGCLHVVSLANVDCGVGDSQSDAV
jgi:hypothetical protein